MEYLVSLICHACSELLTVLNMSFTHKMPCGECCVLAFSRQDVLCQAVSVGFSLLMLRGTLVPLSVPIMLIIQGSSWHPVSSTSLLKSITFLIV